MAKRKMLINYVPGEECRIALIEDGKLEELYHERARNESHVGNIYKGRVTNVEPSIQAAFVDFGLDRNGFLHITDLHPMHFPQGAREELEKVGKKTPHRERPPIQKCLRRGQEVIVQVLKEGIGTKGPTLTTYLSIPGRFLVMMPNMERHGVSRKVDDDDARKEMRRILDELDPPQGFGCIVRTAGIGRNKTDLKRDLAYLQRLWRRIDRRRKGTKVGELYTESDLIIRTLRDVYSSDVNQVIIDDESAARRAHDFLSIVSPRSGSTVVYYKDAIPIFDRFNIEAQIDCINSRTVPLPSGGSLVIDQTEALVAIDVNSGKMREHNDAETTAFKTNQEAIDEICRQLRLRDLGGVVVNDLIDMRETRHRRSLEARMKENLKKDRAKTRVLSINQFGIMAMTRQRMKPSLNSSIYTSCRACDGAGHVKSPESIVLAVMRRLSLAMARKNVAKVELTISPDVAFQVLNNKRVQLVSLEERHQTPVTVRVHNSAQVDEVLIKAFDDRGGLVDVTEKPKFVEPELIPVAELPDVEHVDDTDEPLDELQEVEEAQSEAEEAQEPTQGESTDTKRRRRRRGGRGRGKRKRDVREQSDSKADSTEQSNEESVESADTSTQDADSTDSESATNDEEGSRRRKRRRGGRGRRKKTEDNKDDQAQATGDADADQEPKAKSGKKKSTTRRRTRGRGKSTRNDSTANKADQDKPATSEKPADDSAPAEGTGYHNPVIQGND